MLLLWLVCFPVVLALNLVSITGYGFVPRVIVDGGANIGAWSKEVRRIFPTTKLVMVEAQPDLEADLRAWAKQDGNAILVSCALSNGPGKVKFFTAGKGATGASMFKENTHHYANTIPIEVDSRSLDDILTSLGLLDQVDFIKLDVQGAEVKALQGSTDTR
jgi:FkbM family methyltransferase